MARSLAKVIVLSRNEYDLIDDFLTYYGTIFGHENVVVVDNGSDDARVLQAYKKYEALGVTIESDRDGMMSMSQIVTDAMRRHKSSCEFLIPLDTDEFMYLPGKLDIRDVTQARHAILDHLIKIPDDVSILKYGKFLGSIAEKTSEDYSKYKHAKPTHYIKTFYDQGWDKVIVRSSAFISISQGNHRVRVTRGSTMTSDLLGLLHFHETGALRTRERCIMSLIGYKQMSLLELRGPVEEQLKTCDNVIASKNFGGHRAEQYRVFLRREIVAREYVRLLARLPDPNDAAELARDDSAWIRRGTIASAILSTAPFVKEVVSEDIDEVVYFEEGRKKEVDIHYIDQVCEFMSSLG